MSGLRFWDGAAYQDAEALRHAEGGDWPDAQGLWHWDGADWVPVMAAAPEGAIMMWSGAAHEVPEGWYICDGQNGTPDLRDRFVVGAGDTYQVGETGGEDEVTLTEEEMAAHAHGAEDTNAVGDHDHEFERQNTGSLTYPLAGHPLTTTASIQWLNTSEDEHSHPVNLDAVGGGDPHENRPPYYAILFIQRRAAA